MTVRHTRTMVANDAPGMNQSVTIRLKLAWSGVAFLLLALAACGSEPTPLARDPGARRSSRTPGCAR